MTIIIAVIFILLVVGFIIGLIYIFKRKEYPEKPKDTSIIINIMKDKTEGYGLGIEDTLLTREGKKKYMKHISFIPIDVDTKAIEEGKETPKIQKVITNSFLEIILPKGSLSKRWNFKIITPKDPNLMPKELKETILGSAITKEIIIARCQENLAKAYEAGSDAQAEIIVRHAMGELSELDMKVNKLRVTNMINATADLIKGGKDGKEQS